MAKGIIGRKVGMTQVFDENGDRIPVSVIVAGPCTVVRKKSVEGKDGYAALVLGFEDVRSAEVEGETVYKASKPKLGVFEKLGLEKPKKILRELRVEESELDKYEVGQELGPDVFAKGEWVDVSGTSKGRGFTGVMKRHNMGGFKASHGTHEYFRHGGSIGMSAWPAHVMKGKRMPGQHGNVRVTTQNLKVIEVDVEKGFILIQGSVPGANGGLVMIKDSVKKRRMLAVGG